MEMGTLQLKRYNNDDKEYILTILQLSRWGRCHHLHSKQGEGPTSIEKGQSDMLAFYQHDMIDIFRRGLDNKIITEKEILECLTEMVWLSSRSSIILRDMDMNV